MVAVVACAAPTAPNSAAQLDSNPLTFLPAPSHGGVDHLSDGWNAPVIPIVPRNLVDPEKSFSIPGVDIEAKGILDGFVVIVVV